ncbi:MAG: hypothetical protein DA330_00835 [Nitrososphaera sp.]|nr:hypothetical protein [Nitrososphaera sp.]
MTLDPNAFLSMTVDGANSTQLALIEEGDYTAQIVSVETRKIDFRSGDRAGTSGISLDVTWEITDEEVRKKLGYTPKARQSMILDLTPSNGLDMGKNKNVNLGRLREALDQNKDGQAWGPLMLKGCVAIISIKHRTDKEDPAKVYAEVRGVKGL